MAEKKVRLKRRIPSNRDTRYQLPLFFGILAVIFVVFMLSMYFIQKSRDARLGTDASLRTNDLFFRLQIERATFTRGEPIKVRLSVTNVSAKPITLQFENSLEFDFVIQQEVNMLFVEVPMDVWKFSAKSVPQAKPHAIVVPPGQEKVFTALWDQTDSAGNPVRPGRYIITGTLTAVDRTESLRVRGQTN